MLLNLLNLYSLIFALFSKIEGMSVALNQLKPNATNATTAPNNTWIYGTMIPNGSCAEEVVSCGPCSIHIILSAIDGTPVENIFTSSNASNPEQLKMYLDTFASDIAKHLNLNNDLIAENLIKNPDNDLETTTISASNKELIRLKKLLSDITNLPDKNDSYSKFDDELFDIFTSNENETSTEVNIDETSNTDLPTSDVYTETSSMVNDEHTFTDDPMTASTEFEATTYDNKLMTEDYAGLTDISTDFTTVPYLQESTQFTTETDDTTSKYTSESDLKYMTKEIIDPYTNTPYKTYKWTEATDLPTSALTYTDGITDGPVTSIYNRKLCPDLLFNCTTICGGKNITQVFSISNCSVINRVCYERKCEIYITENMTATNATDIVYEDEKHIKQYNLTVPTRKKLLKLCWETMFGQELIKLTMMDLVSEI